MMKRTGVFMVVFLVTLCTGMAGAQEKIRVAGAGGMIPLLTELAKTYMAEHNNVVIEVAQRSIESKGGVMSAAEGRVEIGMSARPLKDDEKGLGLQMTEIARLATVFGVNRSVTLKELTSEQICQIYGGRITSWKELGGGKDAIMALSRTDHDATKETVRKGIPCFKNLKEASSVVTIATAPEMTKVLAMRPNSIGITDAIAVDGSAGEIVPLKIDGIDPTPEQVKSGRYKIIKNFYLVTKGPASGPAREFIGFIKGPKGAKIIESLKAVPVK